MASSLITVRPLPPAANGDRAAGAAADLAPAADVDATATTSPSFKSPETISVLTSIGDTGLHVDRLQRAVLDLPQHRSAIVPARGRRGIGAEPQGGIRNRQDIVAFRHGHGDVRGHARLELEVGIRDVDHGRVGDDVLHGLRREAHLRYRAAELSAGYASTVKLTSLPGCELPHVGFVDVRQHLHAREVVGDQEHVGAWRLAATVWPTSTLRATTTPSIGALMTV